jgi:hypothetical protein
LIKIDEYEKLLKKTGFEISNIINTGQGVSLIEVVNKVCGTTLITSVSL